jgi:hypothetical protein
MGRTAQILAIHVVEITDIGTCFLSFADLPNSDVLSHVMKGLHLFTPEGNTHIETHDPLWQGEKEETNLTGQYSHEEYCLTLREKFLFSFFEQLQIDLEKLRSDVSWMISFISIS